MAELAEGAPKDHGFPSPRVAQERHMAAAGEGEGAWETAQMQAC